MKKQDAINYFGGARPLAKLLEITPEAIYLWGTTVPRRRQYEIEFLSNGALKAERPKHKPQAEDAQRRVGAD